KNVIQIKTSEVLKIDLDDESIDAVLLYDVLHYINTEERRQLYSEVFRILKTGTLLLRTTGCPGEISNSVKYLDVIPLVELYYLDSGGNEGSVEDILHSIFIGQ
ncbi:MAG: class I SAM-dependent methyltransferase, partial [Proteobacteria bacterium]|nr:class I SAM-dependent methyltransferase [Pseudomonadota bacterium]